MLQYDQGHNTNGTKQNKTEQQKKTENYKTAKSLHIMPNNKGT